MDEEDATISDRDFFKTANKFHDIEKYERSDFLGVGRYGRVNIYKGLQLKEGEVDPKLPKYIAIKIFNQDLQASFRPYKEMFMAKERSRGSKKASRMRQVLQREIDIHWSLEHPSIVKCHGYCIVENALALAMDLCDRDNLKNFRLHRTANKKTFNPGQTRRIVRQLCTGLEFMRAQGKHGVVHRDLKPDNILVTSSRPLNVAISDFGTAKVLQTHNRRLTQCIGSDHFMAPEILDESRRLDMDNAGDKGHAADVYSLGVIGFQLVTGELLPKATDEAKVRGDFEEKKGSIADKSFADFLDLCLKWDPNQRIKKADLLKHAYFQEDDEPEEPEGGGDNSSQLGASSRPQLADILDYFDAKWFEDIAMYERKKVLGQGGFGVVFQYELRAPDETLPRNLAVKTFHQDMQRNLLSEDNRLDARELNIHGSLDGHPNIVRSYGYCLVDNALALTMELCTENLSQYIKHNKPENKLPDGETRVVMKQLSSGLHFLRVQGKHGIVHRNLKPASVLLTSLDPLNVAIAHFGLSRVIQSSSSTLTRKVGTLFYMAPEQFNDALDLNAGDLGHAIDVYSLGVIGFELITGERLPWAGDQEVVSKEFDKNKDAIVDENFVDFLKSCLRWNPNERILKQDLLDHQYFDGLLKVLQNLESRKSNIRAAHVSGRRHLLCGHRDGTISLTDLDTMEIVASEKQHSGSIDCIASNSRLILCGSRDEHISLWKRPVAGVPSLTLLKKVDLEDTIASCTMNNSHVAVVCGSGLIKVFKIKGEDMDETPVTIRQRNHTRIGPVLARPSGDQLWVAEADSIAVYEAGCKKETLQLDGTISCLSVSEDGAKVWVGTADGRLHIHHASDGTHTRVGLEAGGPVNQVEAIRGDTKRLLVNSGEGVITALDGATGSNQEIVLQESAVERFFVISHDVFAFREAHVLKFVRF